MTARPNPAKKMLRPCRAASAALKPPACPQTMTGRSLRLAFALMNENGRVSCGPLLLSSACMRVAGFLLPLGFIGRTGRRAAGSSAVTVVGARLSVTPLPYRVRAIVE